MRLFPSKATCCDADVTKETAVLESQRGRRRVRAKQIHHYRRRDEARFWHWSDREVVQA